MLCRLPARVDPLRLARQRVGWKGTLPVAEMARLEALAGNGAGSADFDVRFHLSISGASRLTGRVTATLRMRCQRCLEPMDVPVASSLRLAFTGNDEARANAEIAAGYEPMEEDGPVGLLALVEDEILLATPEFPMHPPGACTSAEEAAPHVPAESPLAALGVLRDGRGTSRT